MSFEPSLHSGLYEYIDFEYIQVPKYFTEESIKCHCEKMKEQYSKLTKNWSVELNCEWVLRHYFAVKMVLSATLMLNSLDYASEKNIRIVEPYLLYYAMLNSCRALIMTLPRQEWDDGKLRMLKHNKIINITCDHVARISKNVSEKVKKLFVQQKCQGNYSLIVFPQMAYM